jgi:hypothetical protein
MTQNTLTSTFNKVAKKEDKTNKNIVPITIGIITILKENFIKLLIFSSCFFPKYSGMSLINVVGKPSITIADNRSAVLIDVETIPYSAGFKVLPRNHQKIKDKIIIEN